MTLGKCPAIQGPILVLATVLTPLGPELSLLQWIWFPGFPFWEIDLTSYYAVNIEQVERKPSFAKDNWTISDSRQGTPTANQYNSREQKGLGNNVSSACTI